MGQTELSDWQFGGEITRTCILPNLPECPV